MANMIAGYSNGGSDIQKKNNLYTHSHIVSDVVVSYSSILLLVVDIKK